MKYEYILFIIALILMSEVFYYFKFRQNAIIDKSLIYPSSLFSSTERNGMIAQLERDIMLPLFPRYDKMFPNSLSIIPIWIVTPANSSCIHRFFDSSPFSPSGKFLAVTCLTPGYNEYLSLPLSKPTPSQVVVYEIQSQSIVANITTFGWDSQVGAHVQWGKDDEHLLFNDVTNNTAHGVVYNIYTKKARTLSNTVYHVSNNGNFAVTPSLAKIRFTQLGYGLYVRHVKPNNRYNLDSDGYYVVDIATGASKVLVSLNTLKQYLPRCFVSSMSTMYGFHVKWSSDDQLIMLIVRTVTVGGRRIQHIFTINREHSRVNYVTSWSSMHSVKSPECLVLDGNHPNWIPNTHLFSINRGRKKPWDLVVFDADSGTNGTARWLLSGRSTGHPNVMWINETDSNYVAIVDSYFKEKGLFGNDIDSLVPLRLIVGNMTRYSEIWLTRINVSHKTGQNAWRCDAHVTYDRSRKWIAFNARPYSKNRQVLIGYIGANPHGFFVHDSK